LWILNIHAPLTIHNYYQGMRVDPEDLVDSGEVAALLGLSSSNAVSTYRRRYEDFPEPVLTKGSGKCVLWVRADVEEWLSRRRRSR